MGSFRRLNRRRGGTLIVCGVIVLLSLTGHSQMSAGNSDRVEAVGPLIARGYTGAHSASALVAGDPEGGEIVSELAVRAGEHVRRGQVVAVLSNYLAAELEIHKIRADIDRVRAREQSMLSGFRATEIRVQEIVVKLAEANYHLKALELARTTLPSDERELRLTLFLRKVERERARLVARKEYLDADLVLAQSDLTILNGRLENAEHSREQTLVRAPLDGMVVEIIARTGERVSPRGILQIIDLAQMRLYADVDEIHLNKLRVGGGVEFTFRGDDIVHVGRIAKLPFTVKRTKRSDADLGESNVRLAEIEIMPANQSTMAQLVGRESRIVFR